MNMSDLANSTGVSATTLSEWMSILEASFIVFRLPPYHTNFGKRLIKSPKVYFYDPGLASYLLGIRDPGQVGIHPQLGGLFENMVVVEALKARYNQGEDSNLFFFRDNNGLEADIVLETTSGLIPVEVKASRTFSTDFCKNLAALHKTDKAFTAGVVLYAGDIESEFKGIHVLNFSATGLVVSTGGSFSGLDRRSHSV